MSGRNNKRFWRVLLLLAGFSLLQYLTEGTVEWPSALYQKIGHVLAEARDTPGIATASDFDLTGRVVRVADGDTVSILDSSNTQHKVRLYGIDTPERDQPYGAAAKRALAQLVANQTVGVVIVTKDTYGREVGTLYREAVNINAAMVANGYAWWYAYYAPGEHTLQEAERAAREQRLGLWADPDPVPPWDWRRHQR